ncbi:MAG: PAS domain S-box protein [Bacteroidales bacterium]|jgi:PAS domain S-box-containing protein|nr:PAS domain S-box protein [Bacteroidales bacterium]MDD4213565.1 PAS domain S-box protein [Bacteroidales bacterium]
MVLNLIILILTAVVLIFTLVFIFRMLDYVKSRRSWIIIGVAMVLLIIAQFIEIYNLYSQSNRSTILTVYFILVFIVAILLSVGVLRIGNLLRNVKKADQRRIESENRFKLLFDNSGDEIFLADFDGNIIEVNHEAIKRLGYTRKELMKKNFADIKTPKYIPLVKKNIDLIIKNGHHIYETEHIAKNGSVIFLEVSSRVIDYFGKKAILSLARDITDRKEIERKIAATIIETEERERQRFAADLHDGLAPLLSTIKLYTDLLKKGNFNKISPAETLQAIDELVDKAIVSTREISNNIMPSILHDFGLPVAVKDFCNYIINTQSVKIKLDASQYKLTGPRIEETVLFQSIKELVNNSLKHSKAKNIEVFLESNDNQVNLYYKDDGIGFDVEEKLQQPTGLGLNNIVNKIKTINGLSMIKSKEGEGMSVLITLNVK